MTTNEKYELICKKFNIDQYYEKGFKGQNVTICNVESNLKNVDDHGYDVYNVIKTYSPNAKVVSFKDETNLSGIGHFDKMIDWCIENNVDIISCSLDITKKQYLTSLQKAYEHNIIVVCDMNNKEIERDNDDNFISCSDYTISVSSIAIDSKCSISWGGHNYGEAVDVLTVGKQLPIKDNLNNWYSKTGQSFGTPLVASMIALWKSSHVNITSRNVKELIYKYSDDFIYEFDLYHIIKLPSLQDYDYTYEEPVKEETPIKDWKQEFIECWNLAIEKGLVDGTRKDEPITRNELIVILKRLNLF